MAMVVCKWPVKCGNGVDSGRKCETAVRCSALLSWEAIRDWEGERRKLAMDRGEIDKATPPEWTSGGEADGGLSQLWLLFLLA